MARTSSVLLVALVLVAVAATPALSQTISWIYLGDEVGSGLQTSYARARLSDSQHGGVTVRIESSDSTLALVTDDELTPGSKYVDIFVPNGSIDASFYVQALEDTTGQVYLTATATGFATGLDSIDVVVPALDISGLGTSQDSYDQDDPFSIRVGVPNGGNTALYTVQKVRVGGPGLTATITNSNATAAQLVTMPLTGQTVSVAISPGEYTSPGSVAAGGVAFDGLAAGMTDVEATIPGFIQASGTNPFTVTVTEPQFTMINFPTQIGSGLQRSSFRARLSGSQHGGVTVHLESSDSNLVLLSLGRFEPGYPSLDIFVPDGSIDAGFYIQALEDTTGVAIVTATAPGFTDGNGTVTVLQPYFRLNGLITSIDTFDPSDAFTVAVGLPDGSLSYIQSFQEARGGGSGFNFTVTSSDETVGLLETSSTLDDSATVYIPPGQYSSPGAVVSGGVAFDGVGAGAVDVTASNPGFVATAQGTVTVNVTQPTMSWVTLPYPGVGSGLQPATSTRARLSASQHGGVTVHIEVSDTNLALITTDPDSAGSKAVDVFLADGQIDAHFWIQAKEDTAGIISLDCSASGFVPDTTTAEVLEPYVRINGLLGSDDTLNPPDPFTGQIGVTLGANFYVQNVRAGSAGVEVTVTVDDSLVAELLSLADTSHTVTDTITAGNYTTPGSVAAGGFAFDGLSPGTVEVSVSAPGFVSSPTFASKTVTVTAPDITISYLGSVGAGLQTSGRSIFLSTSTHGGVTVRVESLESDLLLLSSAETSPGTPFIDVFVPNGSNSMVYYQHGLEDTAGTATITATATGFIADTDSMDVVQPGVDILLLGTMIDVLEPPDEFYARVGVPGAGNTAVSVGQKRRAGEAPLEVTFISSDGTAAEIIKTGASGDTISIPLAAGFSTTPATVTEGGVALDGLASGQTLVTAQIPGFITTGAGQVTVNVTNQNVFINGLASRLGKDLQSLAASAELGESNHGGTTVHIEVNDTLKAAVSSNALVAGSRFIDVPLANGETEAVFYLQALDTGLVNVTATANTFNTADQDVDIVPAGVRIIELADSMATTDPDDEFIVQVGAVNADSSDIVTPQEIRGGGPARAVSVGSSDPTLAFVILGNTLDDTVSVTLAPGEYQTKTIVAAGGLALKPWNVGTVTVEAAVPGFVTTTAGMPTVVLTGTPTGVEERTPAVFALEQNVPNPFNPTTTIAFSLPAAGPVELIVYDVSGRRVATLLKRDLSAGAASVQWDGRNDHGAWVASGVYFYRLVAGANIETRKMVLLK
jgi:hypothetical protein